MHHFDLSLLEEKEEQLKELLSVYQEINMD